MNIQQQFLSGIGDVRGVTGVGVTTARWVFAGISAFCVMLLAAAYYIQYGPTALQPCPLCVLQRYVYLGLAALALVAAALGTKRLPAMAMAGLLSLCAMIGAALAIWQLTKGGTMTSCLTDPVGEFVYGLPMRAWWPEFLGAYAGCADVIPPIFGVSIPMWSLLCFLAITLTADLLLVNLLRHPHPPPAT